MFLSSITRFSIGGSLDALILMNDLITSRLFPISLMALNPPGRASSNSSKGRPDSGSI